MHTSDDQQHVQHHGVGDRGGDEPDDGLSGFVILRLSRELDRDDGPDLREHAKKLRLGSLVSYLDELRQPPTQRVITSVEPSKLLQLEEQAMDSRLPPLNSLTRYWRIDAQALQQPLEDIVERLSRLDGVELAYAEMVVSEPSIRTVITTLASTVTTLLVASKQRYLNTVPKGIGIGARWAWKQPGGKGQRVGLADIEPGWCLGHEALRGRATMIRIPLRRPTGQLGDELINEDGFGAFIGHHGTAVMGVIAAGGKPYPRIGIAPSLRSLRAASVFNGKTAGAAYVANAVTGACNAMRPGDVLLLEVALSGLPAETDPAAFNAIRLATDQDRIVVEAAGNGNQNLNPKSDSGAIMVGACQTTPDGPINNHARTATSNHGERVNCFAWGNWVETCGGDDMARETSYRDDFAGTSSAAAIIAGAAILTQSMHLARPRPPRQPRRQPLSPDLMRIILSHPNNGTQSPDNIGSMPNLKLIKTQVLNHIFP